MSIDTLQAPEADLTPPMGTLRVVVPESELAPDLQGNVRGIDTAHSYVQYSQPKADFSIADSFEQVEPDQPMVNQRVPISAINRRRLEAKDRLAAGDGRAYKVHDTQVARGKELLLNVGERILDFSVDKPRPIEPIETHRQDRYPQD